MVYIANTRSTNEISVDLTRAFLDRPQPVSVRISGFEYRGEVIFAEQWQAWFGASLPERTMFRLVLLSEHQRVDRIDVTERFIAVAIPPVQEQVTGWSDFTQLNRELGRLNEIREQYVVSGDYELHSLTSSLTDRTSKARHDITEALCDRWRRGEVLTADDVNGRQIQPDSIFISENPAAWVEATAATMFTRPGVSPAIVPDTEPLDPVATFARIIGGEDLSWRTGLDSRIRLATAAGMESIAAEIDADASENQRNAVEGEKVRALLLHHYGFPPGLASLVVIAYLRTRNGEASVASREPGLNGRLDKYSLSTATYDPNLIYSLGWLSPRHSGDWDSALPYLRVLMPHAEPAESGVPTERVASQFVQALEVAGTRATLTLHTLETVAGPETVNLPAVKLAKRLAPVLESDGWSTFYSRARELFPNVAEFAKAVTASTRLRALSEDIVDVQTAHDYIATADFARVDHKLAEDALLLLETVNVAAILESRNAASTELKKYQVWKRLFTVAYMDHHAERRSKDLELARRVKSADAKHEAVRKLAAIQELEGIYDSLFESRWNEMKESVRPCPNSGHEVKLQLQPYCVDCGVRLGSKGVDDDVEALISEIEGMLRESGNRLSRIAASRALTGERKDELRKLISINSIADLTAIADVLDDDVLSFLKKFAGGPPDKPASPA